MNPMSFLMKAVDLISVSPARENARPARANWHTTQAYQMLLTDQVPVTVSVPSQLPRSDQHHLQPLHGCHITVV